MVTKPKSPLVLLLVMAVIITLAYLVLNPTKENAKTEINSTSEPPVENSSATAEQVKENNLSHYRKLLEASPFLLKFDSATGQANDTTVFLKGHSQDKSNTATIHYDPRDEEFYWIEFSVNNMPLKPNRSDIKPLLDFTNLFDSDFSNYFDRNFNGIFKNEDDFVDDGRYMNQKKGLVFIIDGNVALNNTDIKKYPNRKAEIIAIGNFVSINVINVKKPSWLFNDFKRLEIS